MPCYHHASAPQDPPDLFSRSSSPPKNISHQLSARSSQHSPQDPQHIPSQLQHSLSSQLLRLWLISSAQLMPSAPAQPEHTASAPQIFARPTASAHISGKDAQLLSSQPRTVCAQPLSSSHQLQLLRPWLISPARPEHTASDPRHSSHSRSRIFSGASQLWEIQRDDLRVRMHQSRSDPRHSFPELRLWLSFRAFSFHPLCPVFMRSQSYSQRTAGTRSPIYRARIYARACSFSLISFRSDSKTRSFVPLVPSEKLSQITRLPGYPLTAQEFLILPDLCAGSSGADLVSAVSFHSMRPVFMHSLWISGRISETREPI